MCLPLARNDGTLNLGIGGWLSVAGGGCTGDVSAEGSAPLPKRHTMRVCTAPAAQHVMMGEDDKLFGLHSYHDLMADLLMDMGLPLAAVKHEAVEAFLTLSEGVSGLCLF